jgi:hypothetical protein
MSPSSHQRIIHPIMVHHLAALWRRKVPTVKTTKMNNLDVVFWQQFCITMKDKVYKSWKKIKKSSQNSEAVTTQHSPTHPWRGQETNMHTNTSFAWWLKLNYSATPSFTTDFFAGNYLFRCISSVLPRHNTVSARCKSMADGKIYLQISLNTLFIVSIWL